MLVVDGEQQSDVCVSPCQHRATGLAAPGSHKMGRGDGSRPGSSMVLSGWHPSVIPIPPWQSTDHGQVSFPSEMTWARAGGSVPL